ncbi:hypothetical protein NicSoilC12_13840 [Arthrobacter sp. NicSoilC12]|nr:hypothetical protein NicSoilC12_13840 [Arthrobacter sp. NicSoilC12]
MAVWLATFAVGARLCRLAGAATQQQRARGGDDGGTAAGYTEPGGEPRQGGCLLDRFGAVARLGGAN